MSAKTQENKGSRAPVTPPVSHESAPRPGSGHGTGRRSPGLYLLRRGPVFYFRRRSSARIRKIGGKSFLCFSLRTHFPREAMKRAAALLVAIEAAEREIMKDRQKDLSQEEVKVKALMESIFRLPKHHGKKHGKNRFCKDGELLSKFEDIRQADENDRAHLEMMAARTDISELEKRSQLRALLVPRQTPINTQHHLNRLRGIFKAAAKHLGYTGQRRGDVVRMGRQYVRNGVLTIIQQKTGQEVSIPLHADLHAVLDDLHHNNLTFVVSERGGPMTSESFTNWFHRLVRAVVDENGERLLPDGLSPHGLRKAACRRLAEAGCTAHEIMAISGHQTLAEVTRYTVAANRLQLAERAVSRLPQKETRTSTVKPAR